MHLVLLSNLGIAHPLLQSTGSNAEFFVAHNAGTIDVLFLLAVLCLILPAILFFVEWLAALAHPVLMRIVHSSFVLTLLAVILLPAFKSLFTPSGLETPALAFAASAVPVFLYCRNEKIYSTVTLLSPLALAVPVFFLMRPGIRDLSGSEKDFALPSVKATTPVVMVIFDELPLTSLLDAQGQIDSSRFPNFAKLAENSTWFRNTTTISSLTEKAVPAILTGSYPDEARLPTLENHPNNLFTLLGSTYELKVLESVTHLSPRSAASTETLIAKAFFIWKDLSALYLHIVLPSRFTQEIPAVNETWTNFWDEENTGNRRDLFASFLDLFKIKSTRPVLYFLHIMLPHKPWIYLPSGREYKDFGSRVWGMTLTNRGKWQNDDWIATQFLQRHLLQVGYTDLLLGNLVERLKQTGLYDDCILIIASDHGAGFQPGESLRRPVATTLQDIQHVLFLIKLRGRQKSVTSDLRTETIDILPTIADALDIDLPFDVDGHSAIDPSFPARKKRTRYAGSSMQDILTHYQSDLSTTTESFKNRIELFGSGNAFERIFSAGPASDLIGLPVNRVTAQPEEQFEIHLLNQEAFQNVDLQSQFVPSFIAGTIHPKNSVQDPLTLAISINGKICSTTKTFPLRKNRLRFGGIVPDSVFRQGKNEIKVLVLQ